MAINNKKAIILREEQVEKFKDKMDMSPDKFNSNIRYFLHQLLADPVNAQPPTSLKMVGISRSKLLKLLIKRGIIERHEKINDKDKDGNLKPATMKVSFTVKDKIPDEVEYKVPKTDFDRKVEKLRREIFEKNVKVNETKFNTRLGDQIAIAKNSPLTMGFIAPPEDKNKPDSVAWLANRVAEALNANLVLREESSYSHDADNPREESDMFTDEENEIIRIVNKEIERTHQPKTKEKEHYNIYEIRWAEFYYDDIVKTFAMNLVGGFNGSGDWFNYFKVLADFCKRLEEQGIRVFLIDAQNDCADDVYDMQFGLEKKNDELNEEGGDGGATSADASGAFVQPLFKKFVKREIREMVEALSPNSELNNRYRNLGGGFEVHLEDGSVEQSIVTVQNKKTKALYHICFDGTNFNIFRDMNDGQPATHVSYVFDELFNAFQQSGYANMNEGVKGTVFKITEEQLKMLQETDTFSVGGTKTDYQYTVPFSTDSNDESMQRHNGEGGSVSINHIEESKKHKGEDFFKEHGIKEVSCGLGFSEKEQKWYGWSHRAIQGFGIGDKFRECYPDKTKEGKTIKTLEQAKEAAKRFAESVS